MSEWVFADSTGKLVVVSASGVQIAEVDIMPGRMPLSMPGRESVRVPVPGPGRVPLSMPGLMPGSVSMEMAIIRPKDQEPMLAILQFARVSFYRLEFADIGDPKATTQ